MTSSRAFRAIALTVVFTFVAVAAYSDTWDRIKVGEERSFYAESPHPLPVGSANRPAVWSDTISSPGATFIRVHFSRFHLEDGEYVTVSNLDGSDFWTYTGKGLHGHGRFWSFAVAGDTAIVTAHTGKRPGYGYRIDRISHGTLKISPTTEVVCGTDGREDIACYSNNSGINNAQRSVARLLFQSGGLSYVCTGWLVAGSNNSTMMTNAHCVDTQTEVSTVQAKFNYQKTTCGGGSNATTTDYAGGTFLITSSERKKGKSGGLDYTLLTLQGNPEATWGELIPTSTLPTVGENIWFIQHPGGNQKRIGYWEDAAQSVRCKINTINASYGSATPGSQSGYGCDSEGGSSGSPIISESTQQVIGLHHYGGVSSNPCLNAATMMSNICSDAGSLLSCTGTGNNPPTASFTESCTGLSCDFTDTSTDDGSITSWSWDFGDGGTSSAQNPSHTYAADGTYTVSLTVTDDGGLSDSTSHGVTVSGGGSGITLSTTGYKVKGVQHADLTWNGATGANIDVYRDGVILTTTANDGAYTDNIGVKGGGVSYTYQVCEAGTSTCSNTSTVVF